MVAASSLLFTSVNIYVLTLRPCTRFGPPFFFTASSSCWYFVWSQGDIFVFTNDVCAPAVTPTAQSIVTIRVSKQP